MKSRSLAFLTLLASLGGCASVPPETSSSASVPAKVQVPAKPKPVPTAPKLVTGTTVPAQSGSTTQVASAVSGPALNLDQQTQVELFINDLVSKQGFAAQDLEPLFQGFTPDQKILSTMTRPAESMPWYRYRKIFITPKRIEAGNDFWRRNQSTLEQVSAYYQVPAEIILSILGIETFYGRNMGNYPVFQANATLFLGYPRRSDFFRGQLADFLVLSRKEGLDPMRTKGSYAGAMGMPQFISSSYQHYAVDADGDGRRDLWHSIPDITGSVANYFRQHGWHAGEPVAVPARLTPDANPGKFISNDLRPRYTLNDLASAGVYPETDLNGSAAANLPVSLLQVDGENGPQYFLTFHNFYVITRYNRSPLYALAAMELMQRLHAPDRKFVESPPG